MTPIVVEVYADGYVRVHAASRGRYGVSVRIVNRPASDEDAWDAEINEAISRLVARQLPARHRQVYENGWCVATGFAEPWPLERLRDVAERRQLLRDIEWAAEMALTDAADIG